MMAGTGELALLIFTVSVAYAVNTCPKEQEPNWDVGVFLQHEDCHKFYKCVFGRPIEMSCPGGLYFNLETSQCDWKENVDCGTNASHESNENEEPQFLENGCPANFSIHWLLPHENNCNVFYTCISGKKVKRNCPGSLHFDFKLQICDWPKPEGCTNYSNEDSSSENDSSENNSSKEDNIEDDTKEDTSKEDDTNEDVTEEDISKEGDTDEDDTIEDVTKEDSSLENNSSENNSSKEDKTIEDVSEEDISKEDDTTENESKEDNTNEDISVEGVSKEDNSNENDSSNVSTSEENTSEENTSKDETANSRKIKTFETIVDVNLLKR